MKSGKQRRAQIKARRAARAEQAHALEEQARRQRLLAQGVPVNPQALAPFNSYGLPRFVERGVYLDEPFRCQGCGSEEVWRATQQKWWYEVAKGYVYSTAKLCRSCRRKEQARREAARKVHIDGLRMRGTGG